MEKKVVIDISTDIARILDIDEIAGIFHVQFFLHFSWFDSRNVLHECLLSFSCGIALHSYLSLYLLHK